MSWYACRWGELRVNASVFKVWGFFLFFMPLTLWLAFWQLDRALEKQVLLANYEAAQAAPASEMTIVDSLEIQHLSQWWLRGHYAERSFLLDNRTRNGRVGYEVITPFILSSGAQVLINRGWLRGPALRSELPAVPSTPGEVLRIRVSALDRSALLQDMAEAEPGWPKRIQRFAPADLAKELKAPLVPFEFRLASQDQVGALEQGWSLTQTSPAKHHAYALQWFSLSGALLLLSVWATWAFWQRPPAAALKL